MIANDGDAQRRHSTEQVTGCTFFHTERLPFQFRAWLGGLQVL